MLDLDGYEGPIDLLLSLAREQKVDLAKISILALADQYLGLYRRQRQLQPGDRRRLPGDGGVARLSEIAPAAAAAAARTTSRTRPKSPAQLGHRLRLLEAMQTAGRRLMARPRLGGDVFLRGAPEGLGRASRCRCGGSISTNCCAPMASGRRRTTTAVLAIEPSVLHSMDDALKRLARFLGRVPDWRELTRFLPAELRVRADSPLGAGRDLCRGARARPRGAGRVAPGPRRSARSICAARPSERRGRAERGLSGE